MRRIFLTAVSALLCGVFAFTSCSQDEGMVKMTKEVIEVTDTIPGDTVIVEKGWSVNVNVNNFGDSIAIDIELENGEDKHNLSGYAVFFPVKKKYQILADQEYLSLEFANNGRTGGKNERENVTSSRWVDAKTYYYPCEDGNILVCKTKMEHIANLPYVRVSDAVLSALELQSKGTRALYKVKDSPVEAKDLVSLECVGFANDSVMAQELVCDFDREVMAEDEIKEARIVSTGTVPVDPTTVRDSVLVEVTMKSGSKSTFVDYCVRSNSFASVELAPEVVTSFVGYAFDKALGISSYKSEAPVAERTTGNWTVFTKTDQYRGSVVGQKPFETQYLLQTERSEYKNESLGISATFGYIKPEVKEKETYLSATQSDREGFDKAEVVNSIAVNYAGFTTSLKEVKALYKKVEERKVVDHGFDGEKTKKSFTATTMTCEAVHFVLWSDGTKEETHHKWVTPRSLANGESFSRLCEDNTNRTSKPSMNQKSSQKTYKDSEGGNWSGAEESSAISATVEFNGASNASLAWTALEMNSVTLKVDDDVLEFGRDGYNFNLTPTLGNSTKSGDYKVYPYTAALDYTFGSAASEKSSNVGEIKVLEETPFFPEEWGKLEKVVATTTLSEDAKDWDYVWSLHFHNASTGKYYVLPVILTNENPDTPVWNFSQVESCSKADYDLYNGAYYYKGVKNAIASDEREWMQWSMTSSTAYGTIKYRTAEAKNWDKPSYVSGHPTVFTKRYSFSIENGRLFASDTYSGKKITDSHCVNGGWK